MGIIDTHAHLYDKAFDEDRDTIIANAQQAGVTKIILPNISEQTLQPMLGLASQYPKYCYPAIGLHPQEVKDDYQQQLLFVKNELKIRPYIAVGEIGIDLYWDKTYLAQQTRVFVQQVEWALEYHLPIIIHVREAFDQVIEALRPYQDTELKGVFHSFTGEISDFERIIQLGDFKIGINGILTFKNSSLAQTLAHIPIEYILLETDAPYLAPTPFRGKRNETAYITQVRDKLAEIYELPDTTIDQITTASATSLFF